MAISEWIVTDGAGAHADNGGGYAATYAGNFLADMMGATDAAKYTAVGAGYVSTTGVVTKTGAFATGLAGCYAHTKEGAAGAWVEEWHVITASTADTITIAGGLGDNADIDVWVGGAWTLTQGFAKGAAGRRINIKKSAAATYPRGAVDTVTVDGSTASPLVFRGFNATLGDLDAAGRTNGNGDLLTTNFPVIAYADTFRLTATGADYVVWQNLKITGNYSGIVANVASVSSFMVRCFVQNASVNAAAVAATVMYAFDCDFNMSGVSGTLCALQTSANSRIVACHILNAPAIGIQVPNTATVIVRCVFDSCGGDAIAFTSTNVAIIPPFCDCNTIYSCGGDAVSVAGYAYTNPIWVIGNHVTDGASNVLKSAYDATAQLAAFLAHNRTRGNVGIQNGFDDWASATTIAHVTTDTGGVATDFVDGPGGDFRLIATAPAKGAGIPAYMDIGALQRQEAAAGGGPVTHGGMRGGFING